MHPGKPRKWTISGWHEGSPGSGGVYVDGPVLEPGEAVTVTEQTNDDENLETDDMDTSIHVVFPSSTASGWSVMPVQNGWQWSAYGPRGSESGRHYGSRQQAEKRAQAAERRLCPDAR